MTLTNVKNRKELDFNINSNGCFEVSSHRLERDGYARIMINRKHIPAHRFVYREMFGEIPEGLVIRHSCDNPSCINPEHLQIGTQKENMQDKVDRDRHCIGSRHGSSKLKEHDVRKIKFNSQGVTQVQLAQKYGVSQALISAIQLNKNWRHIKDDRGSAR